MERYGAEHTAAMAEGRARAREVRPWRSGPAPYGWRATGGKLVAEPAEQATLARMVELASQGCSLRQIAGALNDEGRRSRTGGRWSYETVRRALLP